LPRAERIVGFVEVSGAWQRIGLRAAGRFAVRAEGRSLWFANDAS